MSALVSSLSGAATLYPAPAGAVASPAQRHRSTTPAPSPAPDDPATGSGARSDNSDSWQVIILIGVFTVAALIVVAALLGAVAIDTWWALALTMVVHGITTGVVFIGVVAVLSGNAGSSLHRVTHFGRRAP